MNTHDLGIFTRCRRERCINPCCRGIALYQRQSRFPFQGRADQKSRLRLTTDRQFHCPPQADHRIQYVADRAGQRFRFHQRSEVRPASSLGQ